MKRYTSILLLFVVFLSCFSCSQDKIQMVSLGIDDIYYLPRMKAYKLSPAFTGTEYRWTLRTTKGDSLLSTDRDYIFLAKDTGTYEMTFEIRDDYTPYKHEFRFVVMHEEVEYSPYLAKVYEYRPAPGQFVNTMPEYEEGNTVDDMRQKAEENISGTNDVMISLGGFGGYIVFGFDHTVMNVEGQKDFMILGNAFYSDVIEYEKRKGGSCEPGIVMVAFDKNQNGLPDEDEWYELAGSEYYNPETIKNYAITYYRPDKNKPPLPDMEQQLSDVTYIPWKDNRGENGYISKNIYHTQSYYPEWLPDKELTFQATRLENNAIDESGIGRYYVLYSFPWGYVDNHPNDLKELNSFDIGWAVDSSGNKVHLPGVDFIKVYTAINQYCGWIGETSTEIIRAQDLHIETNSSVVPNPVSEKIQAQYDKALKRIRENK